MLELTSGAPRPIGGDCNCGEHWGYMGHKAYFADYVCECGHSFKLLQCAAWPITCMDCPACGSELECMLADQKGVNYR